VVERDRLADERNGLLMAALLIGDDAEQMLAVEMARILCQDLPIKRLCRRERTGLVVATGGSEQRLDGSARRLCACRIALLLRASLLAIHAPPMSSIRASCPESAAAHHGVMPARRAAAPQAMAERLVGPAGLEPATTPL